MDSQKDFENIIKRTQIQKILNSAEKQGQENTNFINDAVKDGNFTDEPEQLHNNVNSKLIKNAFKFKQNECGNILTVHHTVQEQNKLMRIRLGVCCFSDGSTQFVAIDKKGTVFVFDLSTKKYWKLMQMVCKASAIKSCVQQKNQYLLGTKLGHLLQLDVENSEIPKQTVVSQYPITEISYSSQPLHTNHLVLIRAGGEAVLVNINTFKSTHRLVFDVMHLSLKFSSFLPQSDKIFTCFTDDSLHMWSSSTLNTLRVINPIKSRNRKLQLLGEEAVPQFNLAPKTAEFQLSYQHLEFANGLILGYCYSTDGNLLCLSTQDRYLVLLSLHTFEIQSTYRLGDFMIKGCAFLPQPKETLILGLTNAGQVVLLDCHNIEFKLIIESMNACRFSISNDGRLLAVVAVTGEANIWSTSHLYNTLKSQKQCIRMLRDAFKQSKPVAPLSTGVSSDGLNEDIKKLLKQNRLLNILNEYGCYPAKYRNIIWCALLQLPFNGNEFQLLLKMGTPAIIKQRSQKLMLKNETLKRSLVKIWSCLAHWCKVFAYSEFLPSLIFPFVKLFPKNAVVAFEICATLLLNHFQLWFEFHPLEPTNYLGMGENLLQHFDADLSHFYGTRHIAPSNYIWIILSNAFSEVLDEEQWLCLWDNVLSRPPYFPIFCAVAYSILQREVITRLVDKESILRFFHEQNPIDVNKLISKAKDMMEKTPPTLHPERYVTSFQSIPKNVYPKFLNYPKEWVTQYEENLQTLQKEQNAIDARIRQLELEEAKMMQRLENGLKEEEHAKRLKEMEKLYQNTLKREEERLSCQRQMLLMYQMEIRSRKGDVIATMQESARRKDIVEKEKELDSLMYSIQRERQRNDSYMMLAEHEVRDQDMEVLAQKYLGNMGTQPLASKYFDDVQHLHDERRCLSKDFKEIFSQQQQRPITTLAKRSDLNLDDIEKKIDEIQNEFKSLTKYK